MLNHNIVVGENVLFIQDNYWETNQLLVFEYLLFHADLKVDLKNYLKLPYETEQDLMCMLICKTAILRERKSTLFPSFKKRCNNRLGDQVFNM